MDAVILYPRSVLRLPSAVAKHNLGKSIFPLKVASINEIMNLLNLAEIADGPSLFASRRDHIQLTISSIRADGNRRGRPPRKNSGTGRLPKDDENNIPQLSNGKVSNPSNQEEIIALFRRIQSSISKGESTSSKRRSSKSSEEKPSAESVLDVLLQSSKQVKVEKTSKEGDKLLTRRRVPPKKVEKTDYASAVDLRLTRPPSNFVKRSPIPSPSSAGGIVEPNTEASSATAEEEEEEEEEVGTVRIEEMKLPALKELAKSRGIKGYSKLKKSELVELLS